MKVVIAGGSGALGSRLAGRRGVPKRLQEAGCAFQFPTLGAALEDLLG